MTASDPHAAGSGGAEAPAGGALVRMLILAVVLGVAGAIAASVFLVVMDEGQSLLFTHVPAWAGWAGPPWWYVAALLLVGAAIVAGAQRLPGATGPGPLSGFHFDTPLASVPSILVAALGTLVFGFALGPEAPLIILGTALGAIVVRRGEDQARQLAMLLGGVAAIGAVFGNPFITAFMVLEFAALGLMPALALVPAFVALAAGYLVQIGIWRIPGVGVHSLSVPGLPVYSSIHLGDLVLGLLVAVVAAVFAIVVRELGLGVERLAVRRRGAALVGVAVVTAAAFAVAVEGFGVAPDEILFSGSSGMAGLVGETSLVIVVMLLVAKGLAYGAALGGGFRGGPIFPATFLGVAVGVGAALIVDGTPLSPLAAAGIAATAAAFTKLPATSSLLGALLIAGAGAAIAPFAIVGGVVGFVARAAVDARRARPG
ncbi:MAG: chloride channel protein [Actinomycetota bacterium]